MKLTGWGNYPVIESKPLGTDQTDWWDKPFISLGNARSYGDSALAKYHLPTQRFNRLLAFDKKTGLLTCESGVLLSEIIEIFLPRGWFLSVTPGTKLIMIGGAIASDVHGKNHHVEGCFSQCLEWFDLLLPTNEVRRCSSIENTDLFHATCGGMGLTGVIQRAAFYLKPVQSRWINQTTIKTTNLKQTFEAFEHNQHHTYSVAWIDCLAKGEQLGRSLLMLGEFFEDGDLAYQPKPRKNIPLGFPTFALNPLSVKAFNVLYYGKAPEGESTQRVDVDTFFYPLDAINNWNRVYGKKGFVQFQFILPKAASFKGLTLVLKSISQASMGSFLTVLKLYGAGNKNWLSFPMEGYSLALDFKMQSGLAEFISDLTDQVIALGGRVYLAKDALLSKEQFEQSYSNVEQFRALRKELNLSCHFQSLQSQRLGL